CAPSVEPALAVNRWNQGASACDCAACGATGAFLASAACAVPTVKKTAPAPRRTLDKRMNDEIPLLRCLYVHRLVPKRCEISDTGTEITTPFGEPYSTIACIAKFNPHLSIPLCGYAHSALYSP